MYTSSSSPVGHYIFCTRGKRDEKYYVFVVMNTTAAAKMYKKTKSLSSLILLLDGDGYRTRKSM
jgi:hypothetical protein